MNDLDLEATKSINQNLTLPKAFEQEKESIWCKWGKKVKAFRAREWEIVWILQVVIRDH
jgi:hypothetical protein